MKLRNKKTGEIESVDYISVARSAFDLYSNEGNKKIASGISPIPLFYESLKELNDEWEDYTPAEPLIKNERIRKAVRAWAEACGVNRVVNGEYDNELCAKGQQFYGAKIVLTKTVALPRGRNYTITELCGEEEE